MPKGGKLFPCIFFWDGGMSTPSGEVVTSNTNTTVIFVSGMILASPLYVELYVVG